MRRKQPWWSLAVLALVVIAIAGYNLWAYNCGFCALQDMKMVGPQVKGVLILIFVAAFIWLALFFCRHRNAGDCRCTHCGRRLLVDWRYCPDCGCQRC